MSEQPRNNKEENRVPIDYIKEWIFYYINYEY